LFTDYVKKNKSGQVKNNSINLDVLQARKVLGADSPKFKPELCKALSVWSLDK